MLKCLVVGRHQSKQRRVLSQNHFVGDDQCSVRVNWSAVGGKSYVVQTNANLGGRFNDLFATPINITGTGENTNNYVDPNAATNSTRFYRVRLGP